MEVAYLRPPWLTESYHPPGMLRLFRSGRCLRLAALSCGFGCFADGANLNDIDQVPRGARHAP